MTNNEAWKRAERLTKDEAERNGRTFDRRGPGTLVTLDRLAKALVLT
jgi:hypothetical protein